jgi:hypothetical protein
VFTLVGVILRLVLEVVHGALAPIASAFGTAVRALVELAVVDAGPIALVAATAAFAVLALLAVAVSLTRPPTQSVDPTAPHPRRAIHDATRLTETHPDAPGHSRPRAPGFAALAA